MSTLYSESVALAADARQLLSTLMRKDQALARRFKRACDEIPVNIAEGMSSTGRAKRAAYASALTLAKEALACIRAASSVGYLTERDLAIETSLSQLIERMAAAQQLAA